MRPTNYVDLPRDARGRPLGREPRVQVRITSRSRQAFDGTLVEIGQSVVLLTRAGLREAQANMALHDDAAEQRAQAHLDRQRELYAEQHPRDTRLEDFRGPRCLGSALLALEGRELRAVTALEVLDPSVPSELRVALAERAEWDAVGAAPATADGESLADLQRQVRELREMLRLPAGKGAKARDGGAD